MLILNSTSFVSMEHSASGEGRTEEKNREKRRKSQGTPSQSWSLFSYPNKVFFLVNIYVEWRRKKMEKDFYVHSGSEANTFPTVFFEWNTEEENNSLLGIASSPSPRRVLSKQDDEWILQALNQKINNQWVNEIGLLKV